MISTIDLSARSAAVKTARAAAARAGATGAPGAEYFAKAISALSEMLEADHEWMRDAVVLIDDVASDLEENGSHSAHVYVLRAHIAKINTAK